jgi:UTP--glucose-1-phosphate uridylyltransferase
MNTSITNTNISQVIIPAAGLGTRFLPFTKAVPKELLPLLNTPAIQYIFSESVASGISDFFIITSAEKKALAQHFGPASGELEKMLARTNKQQLLDALNQLIKNRHIEFINQTEPLGLGHAVLMAKKQISTDYFGVMLPDDIIFAPKIPALAQLAAVSKKYNASVIAVQEVAPEQVSSYGVVAIKHQLEPGIAELTGLVEKPQPQDAPSRLAVIGRYVLSSKIFPLLENTPRGAGGEIQLTDAIDKLIKNGERVIACTISGTRYDIGSPLGWLQANIALGLENPAYAAHIKKMLS